MSAQPKRESEASPAAGEAKRNRLGRGLAALIGDAVAEEGLFDQPAPGEATKNTLPIESIRANSSNPRQVFRDEELTELARSIQEKGLLQPLIVRPVEGAQDSFEIVAGERRWRAAQLARLDQVPVVVRSLSDGQALEIAIIENVQRADLNPVEEANGYRRLMDEFEYTQDDLSKVIGKSRSHVANTLRLINLSDKVKQYIADGLLSAGHARALIGVDNADKLAGEVVKHGLSVRQTEALAKGGSNGSDDEAKGKAHGEGNAKPLTDRDPNIVALENDIAEALGLKVALSHRGPGDGPGEVKIAYRTLEQLDEICWRLMAPRPTPAKQ